MRRIDSMMSLGSSSKPMTPDLKKLNSSNTPTYARQKSLMLNRNNHSSSNQIHSGGLAVDTEDSARALIRSKSFHRNVNRGGNSSGKFSEIFEATEASGFAEFSKGSAAGLKS